MIFRRSAVVAAFFLVFSLFFLCPAEALDAAAPVRVAVIRDQDHFVLTIDGRYEVRDPRTGRSLQSGIRLRPAVVSWHGGAIRIGETHFDYPALLIEPRADAVFSISRRYYRGSLTILAKAGRLTAVNNIDLEAYVRGVLYHEISDKWPMEAIKAQAVATRTFALYSMGQFATREFDMTSDAYSQVYGGRSAERYRTNLAVRQTKGEVLTWKGKIFPAFFHANSGGMTENAAELWAINLDPLKGGVLSVFSKGMPHYNWTVNLRLKDIQDKLAVKGITTGLIEDIKVGELNRSGRIRSLKITARDGRVSYVPGKDFRECVGPNILKSNMYRIEMKGFYADFIGQGWGHGVGMCQWGAYGMAKKRYDYRQILEFYYPGSGIEQIKDQPAVTVPARD